MESIRYLALGDSYTIGTGLTDAAQNFPSLLVKRLSDEVGIDVALVNLGVNGYTTTDLIREELPVARGVRPELLTILIGANNVVQGSDEAAYRTRLAEIYDAVAQLGAAANRVLAVSIPDFSALPGAAPFGAANELRARIEAFNGVAQGEALSRGFQYVDITATSREDHQGHDWLAADGLHPGPAQHRAIADRIWEVIGAGWRSLQWDRWSNAGRLALTRAKGEAISLQSGYIGTEHLLLALAKDSDGAAGQLLKSRQITDEGIRKVISGVLGRSDRNDRGSSQIIPTTRVRKVLRIAVQEARSAGADAVGTEHLLLATMVEGGGIAPDVLSGMGITLARARADLDRLHQQHAATHESAPKPGWAAAIGRRLDRIRRGPRTP